MFSRYAPSVVTNDMDEMSRFVTEVADLVREECCTSMLHDYMTLVRHMVYAQYIEEYKICRITRNFKSSGCSNQSQPRLNKNVSTQGQSGVLSSNLIKEVVLKMASLHLSLVERDIMGNL